MRPPLRYAKTVDGGNVAFTVVGEGYPIVDISYLSWSNCLLEWTTIGFSGYLDSLAKRFRVVRFDPRGFANSGTTFPFERKFSDWILDDLDAVLICLDLGPVALIGQSLYAEQALEYAVTRPERVSHVILWDPSIEPMDLSKTPRGKAAYAVLDEPRVHAEIAANWMLGQSEPAQMRAFADLIVENMTVPHPAGLWVEYRNANVDLTRVYSRVSQPTMVVSGRHATGERDETHERWAREAVARIDNAQLVEFPLRPYLSLDPAIHEAAAKMLAEFVNVETLLASSGPNGAAPGLAALTTRELEILALVAAGRSNAEIGESLVLSAGTVSRHVANIYGKLGIHNRAQATAAYFGVANESSP